MKKCLAIFVFFAINFNIYSQDYNNSQLFIKAEFNLFNKNYIEAAKIYKSLLLKDSTNRIISYHLGLAYLNIPGQSWQALQMFKNVFPDNSGNQEDGQYLIYTGNSRLLEPESRTITMQDTTSFKGFKIKNPFLNYSNIVMSANEKEIVFVNSQSSANKIFIIVKDDDGVWKSPRDITGEIGSDGTFFPSSISADGNRIYLTAYDSFQSDIYVSNLINDVWSPKIKLGSNVNSINWDAHAVETPDGLTLYFSSNRPGGLGAMDIYFCNKVGNDWGKAVNAGSRINTLLNDDYPYFTNNGNTLIYASQGFKNGKDGYDLYFCHVAGENTWTEPKNMGYPVCSSEDDISYIPLSDESQAYFDLFLNRNRIPLSGYIDSKNIKGLNIVGKVYAGTDKKDYSDLSIQVSNSDSPKEPVSIKNNPDGTFVFYIKEGLYNITYSCPGFIQKKQIVMVPYLLRSDTVHINQTLLFDEH